MILECAQEISFWDKTMIEGSDFDPTIPAQFQRMKQDCDESWRSLGPTRETYYRCAASWSDFISSGSKRRKADSNTVIVPGIPGVVTVGETRRPIRPLLSFQRTYMRILAPGAPHVFIETDDEDTFDAMSFERALNDEIARTELGSKIYSPILNALMGVGALRIGRIMRGYDSEGLPITETFLENIAVEDWLHDTSATSMDESAYYGCKYRVTKSVMMSMIPDDQKEVWIEYNNLSPNSGDTNSRRGYTDQYELIDVYFRKERLLVTYAQNATHPIRVINYDGPEKGPFYPIWFMVCPGSASTASPMGQVRELADTIDNTADKLTQSARRQKHVIVMNEGGISTSAGDPKGPTLTKRGAAAINAASHCSVIGMTFQPGTSLGDAIQDVKVGGIDQQLFSFLLQMMQLFSQQSGNLYLLDGQDTSAPTATQEQFLAANSSAAAASMRDRVLFWLGDVCRALGWHLWFSEDDVIVSVDVGDAKGIKRRITPEQRDEQKFYQYRVKIDTNFMPPKSPAEISAVIDKVLANYIIPLAPLMQQEGVSVDGQKLVQTMSRIHDVPQLNSLLKVASEIPTTRAGIRNDSPVRTLKPNTERTYNHVSRSTKTNKFDVAAIVANAAKEE